MDAQTLKTWRKARKLSQAALAEQLGVARETVVRWEAGATINNEVMLDLACKQLEHAQRDQATTTAT